MLGWPPGAAASAQYAQNCKSTLVASDAVVHSEDFQFRVARQQGRFKAARV